MRRIIGCILLGLAFGMIVDGAFNAKKLWHGVVIKETVKEIRVQDPQQDTPITPGPGQFATGPLQVQHRYELADNHLPSGDLQVLGPNKIVWMLTLCPAENNGVLPQFNEGSTYNILYTKGDRCYRFLSAQLIKEGK